MQSKLLEILCGYVVVEVVFDCMDILAAGIYCEYFNESVKREHWRIVSCIDYDIVGMMSSLGLI